MRRGLPLSTVLAIALACSATAVGAGEYDCVPQCRLGCHRCRPCCHSGDGSSRREARAMETNARTVSGALVQPVSLTGLVALPMFAPRAVSWRADDVFSPASSDLDERLDELDARVEALHLRAMTIQRSVELQTKILEEIKSSGTIGGVAIPGLRQDIAPEAKPAEPTVAPDQDTAAAAVQDQHRFTVESLGKLREELEMDPEKNAELLKFIDKVKTGLEALLKPAPAP